MRKGTLVSKGEQKSKKKKARRGKQVCMKVPILPHIVITLLLSINKKARYESIKGPTLVVKLYFKILKELSLLPNVINLYPC